MDIMQLIQSLVWLMAGIGVFITGMNLMGDGLEKSAGSGMKNLLGKISNNRFSCRGRDKRQPTGNGFMETNQ